MCGAFVCLLIVPLRSELWNLQNVIFQEKQLSAALCFADLKGIGGKSMADFEREERGQVRSLSELINQLGHLPLSELTPAQQRELHNATDGVIRPSTREKAIGEKPAP